MRFPVLVLLVSIFALSACKNSSPTSEPREASNLRISVSVEPVQPRMDKPFTVRAQVLDGSGAPVTGAKLSGVLTMKAMDHGSTDFELTERGQGVYEGISKVEMSGDWNLTLTATKAADHAVTELPIPIGD